MCFMPERQSCSKPQLNWRIYNSHSAYANVNVYWIELTDPQVCCFLRPSPVSIHVLP